MHNALHRSRIESLMVVGTLLLLSAAGLARAFTMLTCAYFLPDSKHCVTDHLFHSVFPAKRQVLHSMIAPIYTLMTFSFVVSLLFFVNFVVLFPFLPFEFFFMP